MITEKETELEKMISKVQFTENNYTLKQIKANPKSLDQTIATINQALDYIDKNITRHNFKEQLLSYYEEKL